MDPRPTRHEAFSPDDVRDVLFHTDAEGRWRFLNAAWAEVTGFSVEESLGRVFLEFVHPDDRQRNLEAFRPLIERQKDHCLHEVRYLRRDGGSRWIEVHARLTLGPDGAVTGTTGSLRDLSERRLAQADLARAREQAERAERVTADQAERLRLALSASRQFEWTYDVGTDRLVIGREAAAIIGYPNPPASRTLDEWKAMVHPDDRERAWRLVRACLEGQVGSYETEYRVPVSEGRWRWLRARGRAVSSQPGGRLDRLVGTAMDVTELRELQARLSESARLASVGTLAAGVAHEINNPLAWITANLDHALELLDQPDGWGSAPELRSSLGEALQGTRRISGVVRAMRAVGHPERGEAPSEVDLLAELQGALTMARNQVTQRARLDLELPDGPLRTRATLGTLGGAFLNLLLNAAQAIPDGSPSAHRVAVAVRAADGRVVVEISDTGVGMPAEVLARAFEPFFTTRGIGQGSGLGLSIARGAVEAAGGQVELWSEPGRGTTVRCTLPLLAVEAQPAVPRPVDVAAAPRRDGVAIAPAPRRCVLVLDDEALVRRSMARMLAREHDVTTLGSGAEALERLAGGERFDAILCDLMMPDLDGMAVYQALQGRWPELVSRLAFITGGAFSDRAERFLAEHPVRVLHKPVDGQALRRLVSELAGP